MGIPESKFDDWHGTGADAGSKRARRLVYNALRSERSPLEQKGDEYDVFLQGSYANTTHTWGSSDVDIVAKLTSAWKQDLTELSSEEKERYHNDHTQADYPYNEFKDDVYSALKTKFGWQSLSWEDKAIKISSDKATSLPVDVDVVPCGEYRVYHNYPKYADPEFTNGMYFKPRYGGNQIINYPKLHIDNGKDMSAATNRNYKETIRIFKNARDYINKNRTVFTVDAPSYYIECLLYNLDPGIFRTSSRSDRFINIVESLESNSDNFDTFEQQSEMIALFGNDSTAWEKSAAEDFVDELRDLWDNW